MRHSQTWKKRGKVWVRLGFRLKGDFLTYGWVKQVFDPKKEYSLGYALYPNSGDTLNAQTLPMYEEWLLKHLAVSIPGSFLKKVFFGVDIERDRITGKSYPVITASYKCTYEVEE